MLQHHQPDDFVVATGEAHSVREFCELAFGRAGLDYEQYVVVDERYFRPAEVDYLLGDPSKATRELGWTPATTFADTAEPTRTFAESYSRNTTAPAVTVPNGADTFAVRLTLPPATANTRVATRAVVVVAAGVTVSVCELSVDAAYDPDPLKAAWIV